MTNEQKEKCHVIIHSSSSAAALAGAGLAQLPFSDSVAIVPIQIAMIITIGAVFGIKLTESASASTLGSATATLVGRGLSQVLAGWIPGFGNILNASTAAGITELIGWSVASNFSRQNQRSTRKN